MAAQEQRIKAEWLRWKGTPFARLQARAGAGVDCANLAVVLLRACLNCDLGSLNPPTFGLTRSESIRGGYCLAIERCGLFRGVDGKEIQSGDVLVFAFGRNTEHIGIALDAQTMAHAFPGIGAVEVDLRQDYWASKLKEIYRYA